jgi:hypothetical protein
MSHLGSAWPVLFLTANWQVKIEWPPRRRHRKRPEE